MVVFPPFGNPHWSCTLQYPQHKISTSNSMSALNLRENNGWKKQEILGLNSFKYKSSPVCFKK